MDIKNWAAGAALLTTIVGGAIWIGTLRSDVTNLTERVEALERRPLAMGKATKGDICYKLLDELGRVPDGDFLKLQSISDQVAKFDCYKGVPASTAKTNADAQSEPTNEVRQSAR